MIFVLGDVASIEYLGEGETIESIAATGEDPQMIAELRNWRLVMFLGSRKVKLRSGRGWMKRW